MNFVKSLDLLHVAAKEIPCLTGTGAPTAQTDGAPGVLYMDTVTGALYKCRGGEKKAYRWETLGPVKGIDYFTEDDKAEMVAMVLEALDGSVISGYMDGENIIINNLPAGTYAVKYEMDNGGIMEVGSFVLDAEDEPGSRLPAEYQEVTWVQINALQNHSGIKTDLCWNEVNKIVTKVQNVDTMNQSDMFFSTWDSETTKVAPFIATANGNVCQNASGLTGYTVYPNNVVTTNTDAHTFTMTWESTASEGTIFVGSWQDDVYSNPHKWYFVQFYHDSTLVGEFIPCYRVADNVIGFYDRVSNRFYENVHPNDGFLKGENVM